MEEKFLVKSSVLKLAEKLEEERGENVLSVYVAPNAEVPREAGEAATNVTSATGMIIFHSDSTDLIIVPSFPVMRSEIFCEDKFRTEQLKEIFTKQYVLGVVLMHLGEYAVAVFEGDKIISSKCGKHYVHSKHGKGGYSQRRFSRMREVQIKHYYDEVHRIVKALFEKDADKIDYIIYGGPRVTVSGFLKCNHFLKKISGKTLERVLNVSRANRVELDNVMKEVWRTRVIFLK